MKKSVNAIKRKLKQIQRKCSNLQADVSQPDNVETIRGKRKQTEAKAAAVNAIIAVLLKHTSESK